MYRTGRGVAAVEVKSGMTVADDHFDGLVRVGELVPEVTARVLVHGGAGRQTRRGCEAVPLDELAEVLESFERPPGD